MGRQGKRKRKAVRHLPKVQGDPGQLWGDEPTPWVAGGESMQRWVGRAGPEAQKAYFRSHPGVGVGFRVAGLVAAGVVVVAAVVMAVR
jgi:hypothetical protein